MARLNKWKIGENLYLALKESGKVIEDEEWLFFDRQSIDYYMTLLAASLSLEKHFSPLTFDGSFEPMINRAKRGDNPKAKKQDLGVPRHVLAGPQSLKIIQIPADAA